MELSILYLTGLPVKVSKMMFFRFKTLMKYHMAYSYSLLQLKPSSENKLQFYLVIITNDPSIFTVDHPKCNESIHQCRFLDQVLLLPDVYNFFSCFKVVFLCP